MIRPICKDTILLSKKSLPATKDDLPLARDLLDTLQANAERCVGMAANMIGVHKRIIVFSAGPMNFAMLNPRITKKTGSYETEEGCLSLSGERKTIRYEHIEVEFMDMSWQKRRQSYSGYVAQIIQHEVDHCEGILI